MSDNFASGLVSVAAISGVLAVALWGWRAMQRHVEGGGRLNDDWLRKDQVFRPPWWLGSLFGAMSFGLPFAALAYHEYVEDRSFYCGMAGLVGLFGCGGLIAHFFTSVTVSGSTVSYRSVGTNFTFDLRDVRSAWTFRLYFIVDVGLPRRYVMTAILARADRLLSILNSGHLRSGSPGHQPAP